MIDKEKIIDSRNHLPNLRLDEFKEIDVLENDFDMEIFVEPTISSSKVCCTYCGSSITTTHAREERFFRDLNMYGKRVGVAIQGKRYKCVTCGKTFALNYSSIANNSRLSNRLRKEIQRKSLNRTFTSVAEEYGLGATTVEDAFNNYSEILNLRPDVIAPKVLGIDECHLQKEMHAVYADIENATVLEMGCSIKKNDVIKDLIAFKNLSNVEVVVTDMASGYRTAIQEVLPNAIHVVDKFHVVKMFISSVDDARKVIYNNIKEKIENEEDVNVRNQKMQYFIDLNIDSYMFRMNPENMSDWRYFKMMEICDEYPEFQQLATLRKIFFRIYESQTEEEARKAYVFWKSCIPRKSEAYRSMEKLAKTTFRNWDTEIFNYFKVSGRKTNATTERLNGAIKSMQNSGRGYSFKVLRAKILFGTMTSKAPLYQRISKQKIHQNTLVETSEKELTKFVTAHKESEPFELLPCDGGGSIQLDDYYGGVVKTMSDYEYAKYLQTHPADSYSEPKVIIRNPELELVENGGAPIEKIIEYCNKYGECI